MTKAKLGYLLTGIVIGGVVAALAVSWNWNRQFQRWYVMEAYELAFVTEESVSGRCDELARHHLELLPETVRSLERAPLAEKDRLDLLRRYRDVYSALEEDPPPELVALFANLPPLEDRGAR